MTHTDQFEEIVKEWMEHPELAGKYGYCNSIFAKKIADWWLAKLHHIREETEKEMMENHYCCKYRTIKKEDFCDHCLSHLERDNQTHI